MLVCGEDLGMIPDCVPEIMDELEILCLKIQRMPSEPHLEFGLTDLYPYMSVATPSCHDMSTIRGWWEEMSNEQKQKFYNNILGYNGEPPVYCEPFIVEKILQDHLESDSMWAVFPIQDLVALDEDIRRENPIDEQINIPANPKHYWCYRFHLDIEDLLEHDDLNNQIYRLIDNAKRAAVSY